MPSNDAGVFVVGITTTDGKYPPLEDIASFLYDVNLLYEFIRVIEDERYARYKFTRHSTFRNNYRINSQDRLTVVRLSKESPLEIIFSIGVTVLGGAALYPALKSLKIFIDTIETAVNIPVKHKILKLQAAKLEQDLEQAAKEKPQVLQDIHVFREHLRRREGEYYFERIEKRLRDSPIKPTFIGVQRVNEIPEPEEAAEVLEMDDEEDDEEPSG